MGHMRVKFRPSSSLGTWSVRLIAVALAFFILFFVLVASGQRGGETFFSNPLLAITILLAGILATGSFFIGIIGIARIRERSVLVFLATTAGLLVLLFGLAEIIFPH